MGTVSVLTYIIATQMKLILCIKHKTTVTLKYLKILIHLFWDSKYLPGYKIYPKNVSNPWQCAYYFD